MRQTNPAEPLAYAGSVVSVLSSLTLTDVGVILGMVTAGATFVLNAYYLRRRDERYAEKMRRDEAERATRMQAEAEEHAARMQVLKEGVAHE